MPTIFDYGYVYIDDVAFFKCFVIRYAVADLMIDGCADGLRVGVVATGVVVQRSRDGLLNLGDVVIGQFVKLVGSDARHNMGCEVIQHF